MTDLDTQLRALVAKHLCIGGDQVVADASFHDDLGADSLDRIEIAMSIEDLFNIEITDDEGDDAIGREGTFGKLCDLVGGKLLAKAGG